MKDFLARNNFTCKNLLNQEISFKTGDYVDDINGYLYKDGIPFCTTTSQLARDRFIWAGDGHEFARLEYETIILFSPRSRVWDIEVPVYDENGNIIDYKKEKREARFLPSEVDYIIEHFPDLVETESFLFNDYFYKGSDILEIKELADYLSR